MKIVLASRNAKKIKELREILSSAISDVEILSLDDVGIYGEIEENGETFEENAFIKAHTAAKSGYIGVGDDSGLAVNALGGAPGVYSARYGGGHGDDQANRNMLLKNMQGIENRKAYFACAMVLAFPSGDEIVAEGRTYGKILQEETGNGGFGYDCLFESDDLKKSFGVATSEEKNAVSHRGRALQQLLEKWNQGTK